MNEAHATASGDVGPGVRRAVAACVFAGVVLRLLQYRANASLWIDELALAENVVRRPFAALLREPLALDQVAPPGFLALAKGSVLVFGSSEMALRLIPLLAGLTSLVLFPVLCRRFQPRWISAFATGLFAVLPTLVGYGAEFKPYTTDVAAAVALTIVAFGVVDVRATTRQFVRAALLGAVLVWFSQGAMFVVTGLGVALTVISVESRRLPPRLAGVLAVWVASTGVAAVSALHRVPPGMREYLDRFWQPGLPPGPVLALIAIGAAALWKWDWRAALLLTGPVATSLIAAAIGVYPFSGRAILFLAPAAIVAVAVCAAWCVEGLARLRMPPRVTAVVPAIAFVGLIALDPPVSRDEETRPVLAQLATHVHQGDAIYVYYAAQRAFAFYAPRVGLHVSDAVIGGCHRGDPRAYLRELDLFRGRPRVWVVRTHEIEPLHEGAVIDGYLGRMGTRTASLRASGATVDLWDLSAAPVVSDGAADAYPLPASSESVLVRFGCGHGPIGPLPADWG